MREKIIEVRNLSYVYPDGTQALKDISFYVEEGESLAVIGPNGAGKSTLLLHLNGLLKAKGTVKIFGQTLTNKNIRELRSKVGLVFQDPNDQLFMPTVADDVAFGLFNQGLPREEVERKVRAIQRDLNLDYCPSKPDFYLSLGEMKKVSLAAVLVLEPEVLILDEPTANFDPGTRKAFIELLKKVPKTKIIASHDLDLVYELCSRVIVLDKGQMIAEGETLDILKKSQLLEAHNLAIPPSLLLDEQRGEINLDLKPMI